MKGGKKKGDKCDHNHYHSGCVYEDGDWRYNDAGLPEVDDILDDDVFGEEVEEDKKSDRGEEEKKDTRDACQHDHYHSGCIYEEGDWRNNEDGEEEVDDLLDDDFF